MNRRWIAAAMVIVVALAAVMAFSALGWAKDTKMAPKQMTITGEVVDLWCYLDHKAMGAGHKACAVACAKAGNPIGILDAKGNVYLAFGGSAPIRFNCPLSSSEEQETPNLLRTPWFPLSLAGRD